MPHSHPLSRGNRPRWRTGERYNDTEERGAFGDGDDVFGDYVNINDSVHFVQHLQNLPEGAVLRLEYLLPNGQRVREYDLLSRPPSLRNYSRQYTADCEREVDEDSVNRTRGRRERGRVGFHHGPEALPLPLGRNSRRQRREYSHERSSDLHSRKPSPGLLEYSPRRRTRRVEQRLGRQHYGREDSCPHVQRPRHRSREADNFDILGSIDASVSRLLRSHSPSNGRNARGHRFPDPGLFERHYEGRYSRYQSLFDGLPPRSPPRSPSPARNRYRGIHHPAVLDSSDYLLSDEYELPALAPLRRPASDTAIESLPSKQIMANDKGEDGKASCPICMEEAMVGTTVANMPCSHWFHFDCIKAWLAQNGTCPLCRTPYGTGSRQARSERSL